MTTRTHPNVWLVAAQEHPDSYNPRRVKKNADGTFSAIATNNSTKRSAVVGADTTSSSSASNTATSNTTTTLASIADSVSSNSLSQYAGVALLVLGGAWLYRRNKHKK